MHPRRITPGAKFTSRPTPRFDFLHNLPEAPLHAELAGKIAALMGSVSLLASQIQNLRRTRDLPPPPLLSERIDLP